MTALPEEFLDKLKQQIIARLDKQDRSYVESLIQNIIIFIKRIQNQPLKEEEKKYPPHKLFSHIEQEGGQTTVETLLHRLRLVNRYCLNTRQDIVEVLTRTRPIGVEKPFSARKAQILWQLFKDPTLPKYKLAKKVGLTPRTVSKDIVELERDHAFRIFTSVDPHRFHLTIKILLFETKSISHTKKLLRYISSNHRFIRAFRLDQDMRRGTITYRYPNQPDGHRIFENRVQWLNNEYFNESQLIQALALHQFISFEMYDPSIHAFSIAPEIVSQVPFDYNKSHLDTLPQPHGFKFTRPFWFDQADFLLADTLYSSGPFAKPEYKQNLLERHGISYSMKTIWKKEKRLRKEKTGFPMIELQIPGFDEDLVFIVFCTQKATSSIRAISAVLPYVMLVKTDCGCLLRIQRPVHTATLTAQLIRKIHHQRGVADVKLIRHQRKFQTPRLQEIIDRWNTKNQQWEIQERDI